MAAPFNNIRSKLARAICAYLASQPNGVNCGTAADILPYNTTAEKTFPNTTVKPAVATPDPPLTGRYSIPVHISIKGFAGQSANDRQADPETPRDAFDSRLANTFDALMGSDDGQTLRVTAKAITAAGRALAVSDGAHHADMANFTLTGWYDGGFGEGQPDEVGCDWEEILIFNAVCCGENVD